MKIRNFLNIIFGVFIVFLLIGIIGHISEERTKKQEQKIAAQDIRQAYLKAGIVKKIQHQTIYVDTEMWGLTTKEKKQEIVNQFSASNEMIGLTPYIKIRDYKSKELYAECEQKPFPVKRAVKIYK